VDETRVLTVKLREREISTWFRNLDVDIGNRLEFNRKRPPAFEEL
jgi:hypothetical protein